MERSDQIEAVLRDALPRVLWTLPFPTLAALELEVHRAEGEPTSVAYDLRRGWLPVIDVRLGSRAQEGLPRWVSELSQRDVVLHALADAVAGRAIGVMQSAGTFDEYAARVLDILRIDALDASSRSWERYLSPSTATAVRERLDAGDIREATARVAREAMAHYLVPVNLAPVDQGMEQLLQDLDDISASAITATISDGTVWAARRDALERWIDAQKSEASPADDFARLLSATGTTSATDTVEILDRAQAVYVTHISSAGVGRYRPSRDLPLAPGPDDVAPASASAPAPAPTRLTPRDALAFEGLLRASRGGAATAELLATVGLLRGTEPRDLVGGVDEARRASVATDLATAVVNARAAAFPLEAQTYLAQTAVALTERDLATAQAIGLADPLSGDYAVPAGTPGSVLDPGITADEQRALILSKASWELAKAGDDERSHELASEAWGLASERMREAWRSDAAQAVHQRRSTFVAIEREAGIELTRPSTLTDAELSVLEGMGVAVRPSAGFDPSARATDEVRGSRSSSSLDGGDPAPTALMPALGSRLPDGPVGVPRPSRSRPTHRIGEDVARLGAAAVSADVPRGPGVRVGGRQVFMEGRSETNDARFMRMDGVSQRLEAAASDRVFARTDAYNQNVGYIVARRPVDLGMPGGTTLQQFYQLTRRNAEAPLAFAYEPAVGIYVRVLPATKYDRSSPAAVLDAEGLHHEQLYEVVLPESIADEVFRRMQEEPEFVGTVVDRVVEQSLPAEAQALWRPSTSGTSLRPRVEDVVRYNRRGAETPVNIAYVDHVGSTPTIEMQPMAPGRSAARGTLE